MKWCKRLRHRRGQRVSRASSTCRSCQSGAIRKHGARARQRRGQLHYCRANAPLYSADDQSAKSVLCNVGHGQHYVTLRAKRTGQVQERVVETAFWNESVCVVRSAVIFIKYDLCSLLYELVTLFWKRKKKKKKCLSLFTGPLSKGCDDISWRKVNKCLRKQGLALPHVHLKEHFHFFFFSYSLYLRGMVGHET